MDKEDAVPPMSKADRETWFQEAREWVRFNAGEVRAGDPQDRAMRFALLALDLAEVARLERENAQFHSDRAQSNPHNAMLAALKELDALREGCGPDELGAIAGKRIAAFIVQYRAAIALAESRP